jgi:hypothetical protein
MTTNPPVRVDIDHLVLPSASPDTAARAATEVRRELAARLSDDVAAAAHPAILDALRRALQEIDP